MQGKKSETVLRDSHIRSVLLKELKLRFSNQEDDLILQEFGCNAARIDVAVVNGALHGFEIKSDCDSLERLGTQIVEYSKIFDYMTLVSGKKLLEVARRKVPVWWGISLAISTCDLVTIRELRRPKKNLILDPHSLAEMLWKREIIQCMRRFGFRHGSAKQPVDELRTEIVRLLPTETLAAEVRVAIKKRGGSGFEWLQTRCDDLSTTASTASARQYRQNLDWLLSLT